MSHVFAKRAEPTPVITALDKPRYLDALQEADRGALRAFVQMLETKAVEGLRYATRSIENMLEGKHSYFHMNGDLSTRSPENGWTRHHGTNGRESVIEVDAAVTSGAAAGRRTRRGRRRSASHRPSVNERPTRDEGMRKIRGITSSISSARGGRYPAMGPAGEGLGKFEDIGLRVPTVDALRVAPRLSRASPQDGPSAFATRPDDAYPRLSPVSAWDRQSIRARDAMTVSAGDDDVGSLSDRLAHALGGDSSVRLAWLHGSRARGTARRESDIDVAVLLDDECAANPSAIKDSIWRLAGALGREVPSDRLDLVLLNHAPALLRHRVIRDGVLLFARSDAERVRFVLWTIREYQDLEPRLREHTRRRVERLKERRADGRYGDILESARRAGKLLGPAAKPR